MKTSLKVFIGISAVVLFSTTTAHAGLLNWMKNPKADTMSDAWQYVGSISLPGLDDISLPTIQANTVIQQNVAPKVQVKTAVAKARYTVSVSAYSSTPDQTDDSPFITAKGTYVRDGIVATNFLPFGTVIKIPDMYGDKVFVVEDRMNKRYWTNVDIWMADRQSAVQFGRRTLTIEVL